MSSAEEQETCASSDIEVISLRSNNGEPLINIQQRTISGQQITAGKTDKSIGGFNSNRQPNKAVILVKSPPPPNLTENIDNKLGTPLDASIQSVLEARETHILGILKFSPRNKLYQNE